MTFSAVSSPRPQADLTAAAPSRVLDIAWFLCFALASSIWCISAAWTIGATFDEPFYIAEGLNVWRTGSHRELHRVGTMPLPIDVATLPLYLWERWTDVRIDPAVDLPRVLPWARMTTLIFLWLTLIYAGLIGRQIAGSWGGRFAVALLACEPNLLAHASLATTDIALTGCLLALLYHFQRGRNESWPRRIAVPGLWFAAAVLAKASGMVYAMLGMMILEAIQHMPIALARDGLRWRFRLVTQYLCDATLISLLGFTLVFVYCGSDWQSEPRLVAWAESLPSGSARDAAVWCAEHLCIFSNAGVALVRQVKHNVQGHGVYIAGEVHPRALWYYFPLLLCIKLPLTLLLTPLVVGLTNRRALANWAFLTACVFLVFSLTFRVQIGLRLILPVVTLAIIGVAAAVAQVKNRQAAIAAFACLMIWSAGASLADWPNALCYTNELWGGTRAGYLHVSDGNYDWGQGLNELSAWQQRHAKAPVAIWYFGADPQLQRLPMKRVALHLARTAEEVCTEVDGHYLAVSVTLLHGAYVPAEHPALALLRKRLPCARTATFLIFDCRKGEPRA